MFKKLKVLAPSKRVRGRLYGAIISHRFPRGRFSVGSNSLDHHDVPLSGLLLTFKSTIPNIALRVSWFWRNRAAASPSINVTYPTNYICGGPGRRWAGVNESRARLREGGDEGDLCPPYTGYYQLLLLMPSDYVIVVANALFAPLFCSPARYSGLWLMQTVQLILQMCGSISALIDSIVSNIYWVKLFKSYLVISHKLSRCLL